MDRLYFKGLNGIRAIAALIVILFHIDLFMPLFKVQPLGYSKYGMAVYGVILFFVLSGFLITYLLISEKDKYNDINIRYFYFRRILRIWPLYYMALIISVLLILFGVIDANLFDKKTGQAFLLYSLFLSNLAYVMGLGLLSFAALWSVGVEEQFYLIWPVILRKSKNILFSLLIVIALYLVIKVALWYFEEGLLFSFVSHTSIDCMAIGGIASYIYFKKCNSLLSIAYNPIIQIVSWGFLVTSIIWKPIHIIALLDYEIHSVFYAIIILNISTNPKSFIDLENSILNFLGKISYGIYVYHLIVISVLSVIFQNITKHGYNGTLIRIFLYFSIIGITLCISYFSLRYYENYFLKKKIGYSKILSNLSS